jgi:lipopolysaccharide export system permease protein
MRLLDRYLLRELLIPFSYCLSGFLIFWMTFDLFANLSEYQNKYRLKPIEVAEHYLVRTPETMVQVLPIAFLLALLYALTNHARHHELTAMRAAGVSLLRLSAPYLALGLLLSLGVFAINELWAPQSVEAAEEILNRHQAKSNDAARMDWVSNVGFYYSQDDDKDRRWWMVESYNLVNGDMIRPRVIWQLPDGTRRQIVAERAEYVDRVWTFTNVNVLEYPAAQDEPPTQDKKPFLPMPVFVETPEQFKSQIKINRLNSFKSVRKAQLSVQEILEYKRLNPTDRNKRAMLDTKLHGRLAAPWTCLVVVLIALPFGAATGRRNVAVGVASSILICFTYFVLLQLALALGTGGYVVPWIAAWSPNAFFALVGLALTWRVR